jgi:GMP synthase (glutamine-hydrolysing)
MYGDDSGGACQIPVDRGWSARPSGGRPESRIECGVIALNILTVQHDLGAPAGLIGERIMAAGGRLATVRPHLGEALPADTGGYDGMLVLGGAMSAADDAQFPHYAALFRLANGFAAAEKPIMGICLGAQLMARAWGAAVYPNSEPEFGFRPLVASPAARDDTLLGGLALPPLMQLHYDTFDLPADATLLATGAVCHHQAYRIGNGVYGFQFHLEVTPDMVREWARLDISRDAARGVDPVALAERQLADHMDAAAEFARQIGDRWMRLVAERRRAAA